MFRNFLHFYFTINSQIGKCNTNLENRIREHRADQLRFFEGAQIFYFKVTSEKESDLYESFLISKYKPMLNKYKRNAVTNCLLQEPRWTLYKRANESYYNSTVLYVCQQLEELIFSGYYTSPKLISCKDVRGNTSKVCSVIIDCSNIVYPEDMNGDAVFECVFSAVSELRLRMINKYGNDIFSKILFENNELTFYFSYYFYEMMIS